MPVKLTTGAPAIHRASSIKEAWELVVKGSPLENLTPKQMKTLKSAFFLGCSVGLQVQDKDLNKFVKEVEDYADSIKKS